MSYDTANVFKKILEGSLPCVKVFEDDEVLAFNDINPKAPTHVLVIPKKEISTFADLCTENTCQFIGSFFQKVYKVAKKIGVDKGFKVVIHNGKEGGQEVFHMHAHIISQSPPSL